MFRDLKEYQEIAKIYTEKVSKPEDLDENRNQMAMKLRQKREANKPQPDSTGKPIPSTAQIRAKNPNVQPGTRVNEVGAEGGGKPSSVPVKKEVSTMTSQGKKRTPAQMMAAKRIASGKSIQDVKDANTRSMQSSARARQVDFKAKRRKPPGEMKSNFEGGVSGKGKATDDFSKDPKYQSTAGTSTDIKKPVKQMGRSAAKRRQMAGSRMEEFTPYDIVLEYLLSTEQAATIEEANYIMTEMDAKTIQSIVAE